MLEKSIERSKAAIEANKIKQLHDIKVKQIQRIMRDNDI